MTGPLSWYKVQTTTLSQLDNKSTAPGYLHPFIFAHKLYFAAAIPQDAYLINKPVFFGACTQDAPSPPVVGDQGLLFAKGPVTRREYNTGHWVILTHYEQLGNHLSEWLEGLSKAS